MGLVKIAGENEEILSKCCGMVDVDLEDSMTTHKESKGSRLRSEGGRVPSRRAKKLGRAEESYKVIRDEWKD